MFRYIFVSFFFFTKHVITKKMISHDIFFSISIKLNFTISLNFLINFLIFSFFYILTLNSLMYNVYIKLKNTLIKIN